MPVELSWYLENRVIQVINSGKITDDDMLDNDQPIINYLNQSSFPLVHMIVDNTKAVYTPSENEFLLKPSSPGILNVVGSSFVRRQHLHALCQCSRHQCVQNAQPHV